MGLDVYVGSLSRYYAGNWETVVQKYAREAGMQCRVVRVGEEPVPWWSSLIGRLLERLGLAPEKPDPVEAILAWRSTLAKALGAKMPGALNWNESPGAPYFTDKPNWDGYGALLLYAITLEQPGLECPSSAAAAAQWTSHPSWAALLADDFNKTKYRTLLLPELWLPVAFDFVFQAPDALGKAVTIGSSQCLLRILKELNDTGLHGAADDLCTWRRDGCREDDTFDTAARFGFSIFLELAEQSVANRVPMKLDY